MKEIWKNVGGIYEKLYQVSNYGNVKSLKKKSGNGGIYKQIILKPSIHKSNGHLYVKFSKNYIKKMFYIHRLVLENFVGPCPEGMECRHLDGKSCNNKLENLCWGTRSENVQDSIKHKTHYGSKFYGESHPQAKINDWIVRVIKKLLVKKELTQNEIGNIFKISRHVVTKINNNKLWKHV